MPDVILLTSLGCKPCSRVKRILTELRTEIPELAIEEVEYTSSTGSKLAVENNVAYPPAVFLNGQLIAKGKVDAEQMIDVIRRSRGAHN